jgi:hypothetical protein
VIVLTIAYVVALACAARALWVRRAGWRMAWEWPANIVILLLGIALVLVTPTTDTFYDHLLYALTGQYHADDLMGYCLFVLALSLSCLNALTRVSRDDEEERAMALRWIWCPVTIAVPLMVMLFITSHTVSDDPTADVWRIHHDGWATAFWVVYMWILLHLMVFHAVTLWPLCRDSRSAWVAKVWLAAVSLGVLALGVWLLPWLGMPIVYDGSRIAACVATAAFSASAIYSWRAKVRPYRKLMLAVGARI